MGACSGIRVIELGSMVTAPLAGQLLADFGAEVIKIEPIEGEVMRSIPPFFHGRSAAFAQWNRNKKSVAIDLKNPASFDIAKKLVASADVVLTNFRSKGLAKLGLDYETVNKDNPGVIFMNVHGYGVSGPYSDFPAYDMVVQGLSGFMPVQGGDGPPQPVRSAVADKVTAYASVMSILAALLHRKNSGEGQRIDISMLDAWTSFMLPEEFYTKTFVDAPAPERWVKGLYHQIKLSDGWIIGYLMTDRHFEAACTSLGVGHIRDDPMFAAPGTRTVYQAELMAAIGKACAHMTVDEFMAIVHANDLPLGRVNTLDEFIADPQVVHNETFVEFEDGDRPELGRMKLIANPIHMEKTPIDSKVFAPDNGAQTDEVLISVGYTSAQISTLREAGAIG